MGDETKMLAGTMQTDPRSGHIKSECIDDHTKHSVSFLTHQLDFPHASLPLREESSGVNPLPCIAESKYAAMIQPSNLER
jgi:hypothetical protein